MSASKGRLFLLPNLLDERALPEACLPAAALDALHRLRHFVVEGEKAAWKLLARVVERSALEAIHLERLDEHSDPASLPALLAPAEAGMDLGILSEAGIPCVADPGGALVALAHDRGITVIPTGGPSSIMLALSASGLEGQRFSFLGYLPQDRGARRAALLDIERGLRSDGGTRIFIETPYRNLRLLEDCLAVLSPQTRLCVAASLSSPDEKIRSAPVASWKAGGWVPAKEPAIFLVGRAPGTGLDPRSGAGHSQRQCRNRKA